MKSDEVGEGAQPSRVNGGRVPLCIDVDFDSLCIGPQKMVNDRPSGSAVKRWNWQRLFRNVARCSKLPDVSELAENHVLHTLDRKFVLDLCVRPTNSGMLPIKAGPVVVSLEKSYVLKSVPSIRQIGVCQAMSVNSTYDRRPNTRYSSEEDPARYAGPVNRCVDGC